MVSTSATEPAKAPAKPAKAPAKKVVVKKVKKVVVKRPDLTDQINKQIKKQDIWNDNLEKFYNDRDGDNFTRSDCSGNKKALFIGINYIGSKKPLKGCISDAKNLYDLITKKYGFKDARILTDDQEDNKLKPTHKNIIDSMKWLVKDAKPGDSLFFHFSGHGTKVKDKNGDEVDGFDEAILPCDYRSKGQIIDDNIYIYLVKPLPRGCRLTATFDCCHSGTMMDLPYTYQCDQTIEVVENEVRKEIFKKTNEVVDSIASGDKKAISRSLHSIFDGSLRNAAHNGVRDETLKKRQCSGEVIQLSGCRDNQTSADVKMGKITTGAMTYALTNLLKGDMEYTYTELLYGIRKLLAARKFAQIPQLSTTRPLRMDDKFFL